MPPANAPLETRLAFLHEGLTGVLAATPPDLVGIESVFHGPNTKSLVTLGQARGVLLAAVGAREVPLVELTPAEVKKAVTGRGGATKEQVAHMVGALLGWRPDEAARTHGKVAAQDATDALGVAVASLQRRTQDRMLAGR